MERNGSAVRGLLFAIVLVAPVWALLVWLFSRF